MYFDDAYDQGYGSYYSDEVCPYSPDTESYYEWWEGYWAAEYYDDERL